MADATINLVVPPVTEAPDAPFTFTVVPELPADDFDFTIVDDGSSAAAYFGAGISSYYDWNYGLAASPIAGTYRSQCAIWREHGGFCVKVVQWVLQRFNDLPVCPSTDTGSNNEVLFRKIISPCMPETLPTGDILNTVVGVYYYVLQIPPAEDDTLFVPNGIILPAADTVLNPAEFVATLLGPVPPVTDPPSVPITF